MGEYRWAMYWNGYPPINYANPRFSNVNVSESIKNILENPEDYQHIFGKNNRYWQSKMTDEERQMRSHPNRSSGWIPNRLTDKRTAMQKEIMSLFTVVYPGDAFFFKNPCLKCGLSKVTANKALKEYYSLLGEKVPEIRTAPTLIEGKEKADQDIIATLAQKYPPKIVQLIPTELPLGRQQTSARFSMGLCGICWDEYTDISREFINKVIENS
jgi:hypothetical protein